MVLPGAAACQQERVGVGLGVVVLGRRVGGVDVLAVDRGVVVLTLGVTHVVAVRARRESRGNSGGLTVKARGPSWGRRISSSPSRTYSSMGCWRSPHGSAWSLNIHERVCPHFG